MVVAAYVVHRHEKNKIYLTMIRQILSHPLSQNLDIDDRGTFDVHREIIFSKKFLKLLYEEWYALLALVLPKGSAPVIELGSGAGFMKQTTPELITTDIVETPRWIDLALDAQALPIAPNSLGAIVMVDVLHHLPKVEQFFKDAGRVMQKNGVIAMIEPWTTPWSRFVYSRFHHEPFQPEIVEWDFPSSGPMSGANGALPWIVFQRDRHKFEAEFPEWEIQTIKLLMPFSYLISGGVSMRSLAPGWSYPIVRGFENLIGRWNRSLAMFALIILKKQEV